MSVYNSAAIAAAMNSVINNVTGGETTPENFKGAVNHGKYIKNPLDVLINTITSQTFNGLEIRRNSDESLSISGTATASTNLYYVNNATTISNDAYQRLGRHKYYVTGGAKGGAVNSYIITIGYKKLLTDTLRTVRIPYGETVILDNTNGAYDYIAPYIAVWRNTTVNFTTNLQIKKG